MSRVTVKCHGGTYPVIAGSGTLDRLGPLTAGSVADLRGARVFAFFDSRLHALHGRRVEAHLRKGCKRSVSFVVPSGEKSKSAAMVRNVHNYLLGERITRSDLVLAAGGGVTSDLIGYVAATTLRGVRWGVVSTTLLGMVDAAIGGKTGINHRMGKNLIGAFWQPSFVLCDTQFLHTLPDRHVVAGFGEIAKYAGLLGSETLSLLRKHLASGQLLEKQRLARLVNHCIECKADIVSRDERESSLRKILNLGHTVGHAVERSLGYGRLLHGEAVILGLCAAIDLSCRIEPARARALQPLREATSELMNFLPRRSIDAVRVLDAIGSDKKRSGSVQEWVLLKRPGKPYMTSDVKKSWVRESIKSTLNTYHRKGGVHA